MSKCLICSAPTFSRRRKIRRHSYGGKIALYCDTCQPYVNRVRNRAHSVVRRAVKRGLLRPVYKHWCADCNQYTAVHYDHRRYAKPVEVTPLCQGCNLKRGPALDMRELVLAMMEADPPKLVPTNLAHEEI